MKTTLISIISLATAGAAAIALVVIALIPSPRPTNQLWFDSPLNSATIPAGSTTLIVHLNPAFAPNTVRVVVRAADGSDAAVINQDTVTATKTGATGDSLFAARLVWSATPGVYTLEPKFLNDGTWTTGGTEQVTVEEANSGPPIVFPAPSAAPTTPAPTATASATPSPSSSAAPKPFATISKTSGALNSNSEYISTYRISAITPANSEVDVQWQRVNDGTAPTSSWTDASCGAQTADPQSSTPASTCTATVNSGEPKNLGYTVNYRVTVDDGKDPVFTSATQSFHVQAVTVIH